MRNRHAAGMDRSGHATFDGHAEAVRAWLRNQLQNLGPETWAQILAGANPPPLRGGLLAAQMRGGLARVACAFEAVVELDIVFRVELSALRVEARDGICPHPA